MFQMVQQLLSLTLTNNRRGGNSPLLIMVYAGDTNVTVCNKALLLLGAEPITSFSDGTPAAQACSTIYEDTKRTTLGMYRWSFTIAKKELARDTASPNSEWTYQYLLPNDILNGVPEAVRTTKSPGGQLFKNWETSRSWYICCLDDRGNRNSY